MGIRHIYVKRLLKCWQSSVLKGLALLTRHSLYIKIKIRICNQNSLTHNTLMPNFDTNVNGADPDQIQHS